MTDERYVYTQDIRDKKSIARSASKTNRNGKGPVKLPSDYLTKKELQKMNGEVKTYDLSKSVKWNVFKFWSKDIQQEYLDKINNTFKATFSDLETMFEASVTTIRRYFRARGLVYKSEKGGRSCKKDPEWKKFCEMNMRDGQVMNFDLAQSELKKLTAIACETTENLKTIKQENPIKFEEVTNEK